MPCRHHFFLFEAVPFPINDDAKEFTSINSVTEGLVHEINERPYPSDVGIFETHFYFIRSAEISRSLDQQPWPFGSGC